MRALSHSNWRAPLYRFYEERLAGRTTFRTLDFLEASQWWSPERVREFQWGELKSLVRHAYEETAFHRQRMDDAGASPDDIRTPEDFARLPIMEKADFARPEEDLLARGADRTRLFTNGSGGSTGAPMRYKHDRLSYEWRQAAHLRGNSWSGARFGTPELHLWGEPLRPMGRLQAAKKRMWHFALNHHHANSYHLSAETMNRYLTEWQLIRPAVVIGYNYSLFLLARHAAVTRTPVPAPRGIIGTAEKLLPEQRDRIQASFGAPVYDRYGCREVMLIGMECEEHHGLHLTAENLYVEVLRPDGSPAAAGETGEVVVTDLHNRAMPFLRYRNGDLAVASDRVCACGRGLPLIEEVAGRAVDMLVTPEGRSISGVFVPMFFKDYTWVEEFQVEQWTPASVTVRLKPAGTLQPRLAEALESDLSRFLGGAVRVELEVVDAIPRAASGKHRPVVSHLSGPEAAADTPAMAA